MFALSDAAATGILGLLGTLVLTAGTVAVALISRDMKRREKAVATASEDFEARWGERGRLLDGMGRDLEHAHARISEVEEREQDCNARLEEANGRLEEALERIAVIEAGGPSGG